MRIQDVADLVVKILPRTEAVARITEVHSTGLTATVILDGKPKTVHVCKGLQPEKNEAAFLRKWRDQWYITAVYSNFVK